MKQIEKHLENEYKRKKIDIINKCTISVNWKVVVGYAQNNQQNRKDKMEFCGGKIKNTPFFAITYRLIKQKAQCSS